MERPRGKAKPIGQRRSGQGQKHRHRQLHFNPAMNPPSLHVDHSQPPNSCIGTTTPHFQLDGFFCYPSEDLTPEENLYPKIFTCGLTGDQSETL